MSKIDSQLSGDGHQFRPLWPVGVIHDGEYEHASYKYHPRRPGVRGTASDGDPVPGYSCRSGEEGCGFP